MFVAQTASLLYRREASCGSAPWPERLNSANALLIGNERYSGLTIVPPVRIAQPTYGRDARATNALPVGNRRLARSLPLARSFRPLLRFEEQSPFAASQAVQVSRLTICATLNRCGVRRFGAWEAQAHRMDSRDWHSPARAPESAAAPGRAEAALWRAAKAGGFVAARAAALREAARFVLTRHHPASDHRTGIAVGIRFSFHTVAALAAMFIS